MKYIFNWKKFNESLNEAFGSYIEIGSCPAEETGVQVSSGGDYHNAMQEECERYKNMLIAKFPNCNKVDVEIKWFPHDFGQYAEVVAKYYSDEGEEQAIFMQDNAPMNWTDTEPVMFEGGSDNDDDIDISDMEVPMPIKGGGVAKYYHGNVSEKDDFGVRIDNEFVDGATTMGSWAIMAPSSFEVYGKGLGLGKGQKYVKQPDGKWLKTQ
jgi:hypothetical protein